MADVEDSHVADYDDDDTDPDKVPVHAAIGEARTPSLPHLVELASSQ